MFLAWNCRLDFRHGPILWSNILNLWWCLTCRYPSYCRPNIWPNENLPELEIGMTECIRLAVNVTSICFFFLYIFTSYLETRLCLQNFFFPFFCVAFKALGKLMMEVGLMLAHHCDRYGMYYWTMAMFSKVYL